MLSRERSLLELWNDPNQDEVLFVLQVITDKPSQGLEQGNSFIPVVILSPNTCKVINLDSPARTLPQDFNPLRYEQEEVQLLPLQNGKAAGMLVLHSPANNESLGRYAFRVTEENGIEIRDPKTDVYFPLYYKDQNGQYKISGQLRQIELESHRVIEANQNLVKSENDRYKERKEKTLDTMREFLDYEPTSLINFHSKVYKAPPMIMLDDERVELEHKSRQGEWLRLLIDQILELNSSLDTRDPRTPELEEKIKDRKIFLSIKFNLLEKDGIISNFPQLYAERVKYIHGSKDTTLEKLKKFIKFKGDMGSFAFTLKFLEVEKREQINIIREEVKALIKSKIDPEIESLRNKIIAPLEFYSNVVDELVLIKALIYLKIITGVSLINLTEQEIDIVNRYPSLKKEDLLNSLEQADRITLKNLIDKDPGLWPLLNQIGEQVPGFVVALCSAALPSSSPSVMRSASFLSSSPSLRSSSFLSSSRSLWIGGLESQTGRMPQINTYAESLQRIVESETTALKKLKQLMKLKEEVRPFLPRENGSSNLEEYEVQSKRVMESIRVNINLLQEKFHIQVIAKLEQYSKDLKDENEINLIMKISIYLKSKAGISLIASSPEEDRLMERYPTLLRIDDLLCSLDDDDKIALENDELLEFLISFTAKVPELRDVLFNQIIFSRAIDLQKIQQLSKLKCYIRPFEAFENDLKKLADLIGLAIRGYQNKLNITAISPLEKFLTDLENNCSEKSRISFLGWITLSDERGAAEISPTKTVVRKIVLCLKVWMGVSKIELSEVELALIHENLNLETGKLLSALTDAEKKALQDPELQSILGRIVLEVPQLQVVLLSAPQDRLRK